MNEQDILDLIQNDEWMMRALAIAERQQLKNWLIGAGFVRNKVWDHLHGFNREGVDTRDIDLVYYDPAGNDEAADEALSKSLSADTDLKWEVVNQFYASRWHSDQPYTSIEDAISQWPETVTGVGVRLSNGYLTLVAPHGIDDLINMRIRKSPKFKGDEAVFRERMKQKNWFRKWSKLVLVED